MKSATHTPSGTAMAMASREAATVVHSNSATPKRRVSPETLHSREVRKFTSLFASAGTAW